MNKREFDIEELKRIPLLNIKYIKISGDKYMNKILFSPTFLAPVGTYNNSYKEELEEYERIKEENKKEKKKTKAEKPSLIATDLLEKALQIDKETNKATLSFYQYAPTKHDLLESFGAKFVSIDVVYKGVGLYFITVSSGLKIQLPRDNRYFTINTDFPVEKEELYLYYDLQDKTYKRTNKKAFEDKVQDVTEFKLKDETAELIFDYKPFFKDLFLMAATFHSTIQNIPSLDTPEVYYQYAERLLNGIPKMKKFYDFYFVIGALAELSYTKINEQIDTVKKHATLLQEVITKEEYQHLYTDKLIHHPAEKEILKHYENTKEQVIDMVKAKYWCNTHTGEFFENAYTFYLKYALTKKFRNADTARAQKEYMMFLTILDNYIDQREIRTLKNPLPADGIFYIAMTEQNDSNELDELYEKKHRQLKKAVENKTFPEYEKFEYIFEEKVEDFDEEADGNN